MNGIKRSHNSKAEGKPSEYDSILKVPIIRDADNASQLPMYSAVMAKLTNDGVCMQDLDQLQQDLEKLLSTSAVRGRCLKKQMDTMDRIEETRDKKDKTHDNKTSVKRKRPDDKSKYHKNGTRIIKKHHIPVNNFVGDVTHDIPKVTLPKIDNSDKFWASIEPYCTHISKDDVAFLDSLLNEFSKEVELKIPDLGAHYADEWSDEVINDEQNLGRSPKSKSGPPIDLKKIGLTSYVRTLCTPLGQKLLTPMEQSSFSSLTEKLKATAGDLNAKYAGGIRMGICMDRRLKKETVENGILNIGDLPKNAPDDEILAEIKKCHQELSSINQYNLEELTKLRALVSSDMEKQELKLELEKIDNMVLEMYNQILMEKKEVLLLEEENDKESVSKQIIKKYESQADSILKKQNILHKKLSDMSQEY